MAGYIYIVTNKKRGVLYIGVTARLKERIVQHKESLIPGFTQKYKTNKLVYFEEYSDIRDAITREKRLKKWNRDWKIHLIEKMNPEWRDFFYEI